MFVGIYYVFDQTWTQGIQYHFLDPLKCIAYSYPTECVSGKQSYMYGAQKHLQNFKIQQI